MGLEMGAASALEKESKIEEKKLAFVFKKFKKKS